MMKKNGLKSEETKTKHFLILIRFYQLQYVTERIRFFPGIMCRLFRLLQYHKGLPDAFRL